MNAHGVGIGNDKIWTDERARDLPHPPVVVAGVGEGYSASGGHWALQRAFTSTPQVFSAPGAFAMAGLSPADVNVLTVYDPFTVVSLMQIEDMGFCPKGAAGRFVEVDRPFCRPRPFENELNALVHRLATSFVAPHRSPS